MSLSTKDLETIRDSIETLLPQTCHILSLTGTLDGQGGFTESWGTATASVKCRLDAARVGREELVAANLQPFSAWTLTVPHDTTITAANRVEVGSDTFNVISVDNGKSWIGSLRCLLEIL